MDREGRGEKGRKVGGPPWVGPEGRGRLAVLTGFGGRAGLRRGGGRLLKGRQSPGRRRVVDVDLVGGGSVCRSGPGGQRRAAGGGGRRPGTAAGARTGTGVGAGGAAGRGRGVGRGGVPGRRGPRGAPSRAAGAGGPRGGPAHGGEAGADAAGRPRRGGGGGLRAAGGGGGLREEEGVLPHALGVHQLGGDVLLDGAHHDPLEQHEAEPQPDEADEEGHDAQPRLLPVPDDAVAAAQLPRRPPGPIPARAPRRRRLCRPGRRGAGSPLAHPRGRPQRGPGASARRGYRRHAAEVGGGARRGAEGAPHSVPPAARHGEPRSAPRSLPRPRSQRDGRAIRRAPGSSPLLLLPPLPGLSFSPLFFFILFYFSPLRAVGREIQPPPSAMPAVTPSWRSRRRAGTFLHIRAPSRLSSFSSPLGAGGSLLAVFLSSAPSPARSPPAMPGRSAAAAAAAAAPASPGCAAGRRRGGAAATPRPRGQPAAGAGPGRPIRGRGPGQEARLGSARHGAAPLPAAPPRSSPARHRNSAEVSRAKNTKERKIQGMERTPCSGGRPWPRRQKYGSGHRIGTHKAAPAKLAAPVQLCIPSAAQGRQASAQKVRRLPPKPNGGFLMRTR